jgi:hypothetical protein
MQKYFSNLFLFLFVTLLTTVPFSLGLFLYQKGYLAKAHDPKYTITHIIARPTAHKLSVDQLSEILGLSMDAPINMYLFSTKKAKKVLESFYLIKHAAVKKVGDNTLKIEYTLRRPYYLIKDYENLAIDDEDILIPMAPFFTPKQLPMFILGLPKQKRDVQGRKGAVLGEKLQCNHLTLAKEVAKITEDPRLTCMTIDTSYAFDPSLGKREVIVSFQEINKENTAWQLRLNPKKIKEQWTLFLKLQKKMKQEKKVFLDLRVDHVILVKNTMS